MFTGIVEAIGSVVCIVQGERSYRLTVAEPRLVGEGLKLGDSVAINGVCLTVDALSTEGFIADVMPETVNCTSFASLRQGSSVNLERSLPVSGRLGGHIVTGHVDGVGTIAATEQDDNATLLKVETGEALLKLMVSKGSVAVDGVSLTAVQIDDDGFWVSLIPHTVEKTVLLRKEIRETVNIECDILGKYVQRLLRAETADRKDLP